MLTRIVCWRRMSTGARRSLAWETLTAQDLESRATTFGRQELAQGDVVLLKVGIGKTCFARGVIQGLVGDSDLIVPSPTYLLENEYGPVSVRGRSCVIRHFDFYRLEKIQRADWEALGLGSALFHDICLIEWPEHALDQLFERASLRGGRIWDVQLCETPQNGRSTRAELYHFDKTGATNHSDAA